MSAKGPNERERIYAAHPLGMKPSFYRIWARDRREAKGARVSWQQLDTHTCPTRKVRYESDNEAAEALERVRVDRAKHPRDKPPERMFYHCEHCDGWHLSSKPPLLGPEPPPRADGETWEEYAHRLERRIKEQRDQLEVINSLRADAGNRAERKRIEHLTIALGNMTLRWERERLNREGLVAQIEAMRSEPSGDSSVSPQGEMPPTGDPGGAAGSANAGIRAE